MYITLKATEGPYKDKHCKVQIKAPNYKCLFGRTVPEDQFRLDADPEISSRHATFLWNAEKDCLQIRDDGSFNGTALNFKVLEKGKLYDVPNGSTLFAGKSKFTVLIEDEKAIIKKNQRKESNQDEEKSSKPLAEPCYCPICFKDLGSMSEIGRTQHVNNCIPEKKEINQADALISKAKKYVKGESYESYTLPQLASIKQKLENVKTLLEIELQKVQTVYYRKRSEEMLHQPTLAQLHNTIQPTSVSSVPSLASASASLTQHDSSKALDIMFSQNELDTAVSHQHVSSMQAALTGANLPLPELLCTPTKKRSTSSLSQESEEVDSFSSDSIITMQTPTKKRPHLTSPGSSSHGIARVTPRRSSILVSPKKVDSMSRLNAIERNKQYEFYVKQIPPTVQAVNRNEIQQWLRSLVMQSIDEIKQTKDSLICQCQNAEVDKKEVFDFLIRVANDIIAEIDTIKPAENRRQTMRRESILSSPTRKIRSTIASPVKTINLKGEELDSLIHQVQEAIKKDANLTYQVESKQIVFFNRIANCIRKSLPSITNQEIQYILDKLGIKYLLKPGV